MQSVFALTWDVAALASAMQMTDQDVIQYFTDGRRVSFVIERRIVAAHPGWKLAPSEGAGYDVLDPDNASWEVRSITRQGVYFTPSNQVGKGRAYDATAFHQKLALVRGFILADIVEFPNVRCFKVPVENVVRWHKASMLGANAKVSRKKFLDDLVEDIRA